MFFFPDISSTRMFLILVALLAILDVSIKNYIFNVKDGLRFRLELTTVANMETCHFN